MEKNIYRPVRFYLITFACTWFWWLFAILLNEGTGLYLGMFLGLVSPAVVAVVTVFTSKNKALINDFKKKLIFPPLNLGLQLLAGFLSWLCHGWSLLSAHRHRKRTIDFLDCPLGLVM